MSTNATLTETRIEIGDRHTTLFHLEGATRTTPLPLGEAAAYRELHQKVSELHRCDYGVLAKGRNSAILNKLMPSYCANEYWRKYLQSSRPGPWHAWNAALPLKATLKRRIALYPPAGFTAKISPVPFEYIYPFGWSTWISIRITGKHTLLDVRELVERLFNEPAWAITGESAPKTLPQLLNIISGGVNEDAFDGSETASIDAPEIAIVTTVLAKHGLSPVLGALSSEDKKTLQRIVRPKGALPLEPFSDMVHRLAIPGDEDYIVLDKFGRFIWMEHLLRNENRNHQHLACYHTNSFVALIQAWHFFGLMQATWNLKNGPRRLQELCETAMYRLRNPTFCNASLKEFLTLDAVRNTISHTAQDSEQ
jgi:hypothetical protein